MVLADALTLALKLIEILEPAIASIVKDWSDGKITAQEADAAADGKFSRMVLALADPQAETDALDAATEAALEKKFAVISPSTITNVSAADPSKSVTIPMATRLGDKEETEFKKEGNFVELKDARVTVPLADLAVNDNGEDKK